MLKSALILLTLTASLFAQGARTVTVDNSGVVKHPPAAQMPAFRTSIGLAPYDNALASALGVKAYAVETIPISEWKNTGEGTYGAAQGFGGTFYNSVKGLYFTVLNNGASSYLTCSDNGVNWNTPFIIDQSPKDFYTSAVGFDSNGYVWAISTYRDAVLANTVSNIRKTNTNGEFWTTPTTIVTGASFAGVGQPAIEFVGPICQIGDGRMVASYASDATPATGLFFFDPTNPATQSNYNLSGVGDSTELCLYYDSANSALVGMMRTDSPSTIPVRMFKLTSPWTTPTITNLTSLSAIDYAGNQITVTKIGTKYVAACTDRSGGQERMLVADVATALSSPATAWTMYPMGSIGQGTALGHLLNGAGGLASNGTDTILRTYGVSHGQYRNRDAELLGIRYQLSPPVVAPVVRESDGVRLKGKRIQTRVLLDNQVSDVQLAKVGTSADTIYTCRGRGVIFLPAEAEEGSKLWVEKSTLPLIVVRTTQLTGQLYSGTWARSGSTITITNNTHGRVSADILAVTASSDLTALPLTSYTPLGSVTADTFTVTSPASGTLTNQTLSYRVYRTESIRWTDGTTYTAGSSFEDNTDKKRTYVFTCVGPMAWVVTCPPAEQEYLASSTALTQNPTASNNIVTRLDILSGRNTTTIKDEFIGGRTATGTIGELRWDFSGASISAHESDVGHPGIAKITTGAANGNQAFLISANSYWVRSTSPPNYWHDEWVFQMPSVSNVYFFIGHLLAFGTYNGSGSASSEGTSSFGIKLDTFTDGNIKAVNTSFAGTPTTTTLGAAVAGIWYRVEEQEIAPNVINFTLTRLDTHAVVGTATHTTNMPAGGSGFSPIAFLHARDGGGAKTMWVDYFNHTMWELNR